MASTRCILDEDAKLRLEKAKELADGKFSAVHNAIEAVINGVDGLARVRLAPRRTYLRNVLTRKLRGHIADKIQREKAREKSRPKTLEDMFGEVAARTMRREARGLDRSAPPSSR